ncbi:hypothetical protein U5B43_01285 [Campylobacter sp. 9BO]|uniref:hypothetical protein n=1 Tax=Campylobacter sp. 9BO TaxID=3424759 RepID=UPI003D32A4BF
MKKFLIFLAILAFIQGCSNKKVIVHEPLKNELLAYTSKDEIIDKNGNTLITATYLNPIYQSKVAIKNEEKFLVAINPKEHEINPQTIALNGNTNGTRARVLEQDDELLKLTGFNMPWGIYYEISAPSKETDNLNLSFEIYPSKKVSLDFLKVSKSLYWYP